ncbi:alpha-tocopherol transfer protein-like [Amblyomma americanum]
MPDEPQRRQPALPEDLMDVARRELGETSDVKEAALSQLRKLIAGEPQLDCPVDEDFLIKFLRARKYDVDSAFKNVKKYFKARIEHPQVLQGLSPQSIPFDATCRKHRLLTVSRERDPEGRAVAMLNIGAWNADICSLNDFFRAGCVHLEYLLLQQEAQIKGFVFIVNVQGLGVYHMAHYTPSVIKRLLSIIQDYLPLRIKGIYIINNPALFDVLFAIAKPFMKAKLLKRIRLFGYDLRELRDLVPVDLISEEHGGTFESFDYDKMERDLHSHSDYFQRINCHGYRSSRSAA